MSKEKNYSLLKERVLSRICSKSVTVEFVECGTTEHVVNTKIVKEVINEEFEGLVDTLQKRKENLEFLLDELEVKMSITQSAKSPLANEYRDKISVYTELLVLLGIKQK